MQSNYVNILWMLLRLRQACDHPRLVKGGHSDVVGRSSMEHARKLSDDKRRILLSILERSSDTCSICSVSSALFRGIVLESYIKTGLIERNALFAGIVFQSF